MLAGRLVGQNQNAFEGKIMVAGAESRISFTEDGITWTDKSNITVTNAVATFDLELYTATSYTFVINLKGDSDGAGTYLIPCNDGRLFKSDDNGTSWDVVRMPGYYFPLFTKYLSGYWWIGNSNGELWRSVDGEKWRLVETISGSKGGLVRVYISDIMTDGTDIVAVGRYNADLKLLKSSDPLGSFTEYTGSSILSSDENPLVCAYGNSVWVVVGTGGLIATSSDARSWTERSVGAIGSNDIKDIKFANSIFMITVEDGTVYTSSDGVTWTTATTPTGVSELSSIEYYDGTWCVAGNNTSNVNVVWESADDGSTWTQRSLSSPYNESTQAEYGDLFVDAEDGEFVLIGPVNLRVQSISSTAFQKGAGASWAEIAIEDVSPNSLLYSIATDGSRWVVVGLFDQGNLTSDGFTAYSDDDGDTWTASVLGLEPVYDIQYNADLSQWIIVGEDGTIYYSSDGASWTSASSGTSNPLYAVGCDGTTWVAVGASGTIRSSTNGSSWTARSPGSGSTDTFLSISYGNSKFVVTGTDGNVQVSANGTSWTQEEIVETSANWVATFNEATSLFYAFPENIEQIWTSSDGASWTQAVASGVGFGVDSGYLLPRSVAYFEHSDESARLWVAAPYDESPSKAGHIYTSKDSINWNAVSLPDFPSGQDAPGLLFKAVAGFATV